MKLLPWSENSLHSVIGQLKPGSSTSAPVPSVSRGKRKRDPNVNEFLPEGPAEEGNEVGSLDFEEVLEESVRR